MTRVLAVSAGLSSPSSTRLLTDRLADAARARLGAGADVDVVELRPLAHALADHLLTGFPDAELEAVLDQVREADALIMVTPVFSASFSGLFKTFVDVLEPGLLLGKPVLIGATAGTSRHSLVLDHALRPLFAYLRAVVVPTGVFAATEDFGDHGLDQRIERAAGELVDLLGGRRSLHVVRDEFADPTPFADRLRGLST
ncbi:FMN reductase [Nocardioides sp. cx-169]|uniref:FMN reductase n=1 Tax=Nocardioides sp. cx-169 TaxID=2899080 RepID=UPI001E3CE355|nr:FMN reductase [Nocardioides sp. cx-169]MCD4535273.1 FMN reductase [Nocardioides sp. cx-169]